MAITPPPNVLSQQKVGHSKANNKENMFCGLVCWLCEGNANYNIMHTHHKHILAGNQSTWKLHGTEIIYWYTWGWIFVELWCKTEEICYCDGFGVCGIDKYNNQPWKNDCEPIRRHQDSISMYTWVYFCRILLMNWGEILLQWFGVCGIGMHNNQELKLMVSLTLFEYGHENRTALI